MEAKNCIFKCTFLPFGVKILAEAEYLTVKFDIDGFAFLFYDLNLIFFSTKAVFDSR